MVQVSLIHTKYCFKTKDRDAPGESSILKLLPLASQARGHVFNPQQSRNKKRGRDGRAGRRDGWREGGREGRRKWHRLVIL